MYGEQIRGTVGQYGKKWGEKGTVRGLEVSVLVDVVFHKSIC